MTSTARRVGQAEQSDTTQTSRTCLPIRAEFDHGYRRTSSARRSDRRNQQVRFPHRIEAVFRARKGLDAEIVSQISDMKNEPDWMRRFPAQGSGDLQFASRCPSGAATSASTSRTSIYYLKPADHQGKTWDDVPEEIKKTFDRLGIPEAEKKFLSGVKAQFESEVDLWLAAGRPGEARA